jgi:NADPH:quinone reductase-like Zn-dependent oxidoreductase
MRAIQIHNYGDVDQLRVEQVSDPVPGPGEILVRTAATSINPIDFKIRSGSAKNRFPQTFPVILGRDLAGQVAALGPGVQGFAVGDRVMGLVWRTYAELVVAKASDACLTPSTLDDVQAAALPLVSLTGAQLIERAGQVSEGQTVLVTGALGGVGRCAVFVAKQHGAHVWAGVRRSQLKDGEALGAERLVPLDDDAVLREVPPLDVLADTVGHEPTLKLLPKIKKSGRLASVVGAPEEARALNVRVEVIMTQPDARRMQQLAEDVAAKRLILPVARVMRFEDIQEAHRLAEQGGIGKIVLRP